MRRPLGLLSVCVLGLCLWFAIAVVHDLTATLAEPLMPQIAWMFP